MIKTIIVPGIIFLVFVASLVFLSYEQGKYNGLKLLCQTGELIVNNNNQIECKEKGFIQKYEASLKPSHDLGGFQINGT